MTAEGEIRRRIRKRGPITFAEFMELALYWPRGGYYCGGGTRGGESGPVGAQGDYYTSPMAHPSFGALLAVQLYQFWLLLERPDPFYVVEPGAGNGQLCRDILAAAAALPDGFPDCLRYLCLERNPVGPSPDQPQATQLVTEGIPLRQAAGLHYFQRTAGRLSRPPGAGGTRGIAGSVRWPGRRRERGRGQAGGGLWANPARRPWRPGWRSWASRWPRGRPPRLTWGWTEWTAAAGGALDAGFVLTIDYGRPAAELYSAAERPRGTLVTYYRHAQTDAPLRHIGEQDITAQVDFTALVNAGERAGLESLGYTTQGQLLRNLGLDHLRRRVTSTPMPVGQGIANRAGLLALTRPGGLGDFKVLIQGKGLPDSGGGHPALWGMAGSPEAVELVRRLPVPLLTEGHISLPGGWPGQGAQEFEFSDLEVGPFGR